MKRLARGVVLSLVMGVATQPAWSLSPCDNVDRSLMDKSKAALAPVIASQLRAKKRRRATVVPIRRLDHNLRGFTRRGRIISVLLARPYPQPLHHQMEWRCSIL